MIYGVRERTSSGRKRSKEELKASYYQNYMVRCSCSHTFLMGNNEDKKLCTRCGKYYYKNKQLEFKEKLKQLLKEN